MTNGFAADVLLAPRVVRTDAAAARVEPHPGLLVEDRAARRELDQDRDADPDRRGQEEQ